MENATTSSIPQETTTTTTSSSSPQISASNDGEEVVESDVNDSSRHETDAQAVVSAQEKANRESEAEALKGTVQ